MGHGVLPAIRRMRMMMLYCYTYCYKAQAGAGGSRRVRRLSLQASLHRSIAQYVLRVHPPVKNPAIHAPASSHKEATIHFSARKALEVHDGDLNC